MVLGPTHTSPREVIIIRMISDARQDENRCCEQTQTFCTLNVSNLTDVSYFT